MPINKKLINFKTKTQFDAKLKSGDILTNSIVFIEDTGQIWTHGKLYGGSINQTANKLNRTEMVYANLPFSYINDGETISFTAPSLDNYATANTSGGILFGSSNTAGYLTIRSGSTDAEFYVRSWYNSNFSSWRKLYHSGNINTSTVNLSAKDLNVYSVISLIGSGKTSFKVTTEPNGGAIQLFDSTGTRKLLLRGYEYSDNIQLLLEAGGIKSAGEIFANNDKKVWHSGNLTGIQVGHGHDVLFSTDKRDVKPNTTSIGQNTKAIKSFFTTTANLGISGYGTYADLLVLDTYSDSSGGNVNAISMMKNSTNLEMFIGNATFGAADWASFKRVWHSGNFDPNNINGITTINHSIGGGGILRINNNNSNASSAQESSIGYRSQGAVKWVVGKGTGGINDSFGWYWEVTGDGPGNKMTLSKTGILNAIGGVQVNGNNVWHASNFNPSNYLALAGGTMTGTITGKHIIASGTGNDYHTLGYESMGNGTANTINPGYGFHQLNLYAGSLQMHNATDFYFWRQGATVRANVYIKEIYSDGWFRSQGNSGWHSENYGGGIYMSDSTWIRIYGNKKFYSSNTDSDSIKSEGGVYAVGGFYKHNSNNTYLLLGGGGHVHTNTYAKNVNASVNTGTGNSVNQAQFFSKLHEVNLFEQNTSTIRGSWWWAGNMGTDTGVGVLKMAGTAVWSVSRDNSADSYYKSCMFLTQNSELYLFTQQEPAYAGGWARVWTTKNLNPNKIGGTLIINPGTANNHSEGIRVNRANNGWANIHFGGANDSTNGTSDATWLVGTNPSKDFLICLNESAVTFGLHLPAGSGSPKWKGTNISLDGHTHDVLSWVKNTDNAQIRFDSAADNNSWLVFRVGDNGGSSTCGFKWYQHHYSAGETEIMKLGCNGLLTLQGGMIANEFVADIKTNYRGLTIRGAYIPMIKFAHNAYNGGNGFELGQDNNGSVFFNFNSGTRALTFRTDLKVEATHGFMGSLSGTADRAGGIVMENYVTYGRSGLQFAQFSGSGGTGGNGSNFTNPTSDWWHNIILNHANSSGYYTQLSTCFHSNEWYSRRMQQGTLNNWVRFWTSGNFTPSDKVDKVSPNRPGVDRVYRSDDNSNYNVRVNWENTYRGYRWIWKGYSGDSYHAECYVDTCGYANSSVMAGFIPPRYDGGVIVNPQQYFDRGIGVRVAMTGTTGSKGDYWGDTLWINGYSGGDVPNCCALHFSRYNARMFLSIQNAGGTSYGTLNEIWHEGNFTVPHRTGIIASGTVNAGNGSFYANHFKVYAPNVTMSVSKVNTGTYRLTHNIETYYPNSGTVGIICTGRGGTPCVVTLTAITSSYLEVKVYGLNGSLINNDFNFLIMHPAI